VGIQAKSEPTRIERGVLAELYVRHAPDGLRLAYLLTGDRAAAEDLVQDAFVRMAGRLVHLRDRGGFGAYLRTTIVNLARSQFRHREIERRYQHVNSTPREATPADHSDREQMRIALLELSPRQRAAIVLRYYEDLSEAQTAEVMRCSVNAVKGLVARGMETLRAGIGEEER
jgi:RNA polymerase sigma-70 factor (sigma-E family)